MATIPTVALSAVPTAPALGPRADVGAFTAVNRAVVGAGAAVADVGAQLGRFAVMKQEQVNRGILAAEETERMKAAGEIAAYAQNNPDKPETWEKVEAETWKAYDQGRGMRAKEQGWGKDLVALDGQVANSYKVETAIRFRAKRDAALIGQSNARLEANAMEHLASGNVTAALSSIDGMTLFDDQRTTMLAQVTNAAEYDYANRTLSDVSQTTVASQVSELAALETYYTGKNAKGEFLNGWVEDAKGERVGGISIRARNDVIERIRTMKEQAGRAQVRSLAPVLDAYEEGGPEAGDLAAQQAIERGDMTREFADRMKPAMVGALRRRDVAMTKEAEAEAKAALATARAQFNEFEQLKKRVDELTPREVAERERLGTISTGQAKELRGRMAGTAFVELDAAVPLVDTKGIEVRKGEDPRLLVESYIARYATAGRDASVEEREAALTSIAEAPITAESKRQLMKRLVEGFDVDFRADYRAQSKAMAASRSATNVAMPGTFGVPVEWVLRSGRKITKGEADVRSKVYGTLQQSGELGQAWTTDFLIKAERDLAAFYEEGGKTPAEALALEFRLLETLKSQASMNVLNGIISN